MAVGKTVVVSCNAAGFTVNENWAVAVPCFESVTVALKVTEPAAGGVPLRIPEELKARQPGNAVALQVLGDWPPAGAKVWLYGVPAVADGSGEAVRMRSAAGFT